MSHRWNIGRVQASAEEFRWEPRWPWTRLRKLPADLQCVRIRDMASREMLWIPADALVIECVSSDGPVWLWGMPVQVKYVIAMIRRGW